MGSFYDTMRAARDVAREVASLDARIQLMDALDMAADLREENESLREENAVLRRRLAAKKRLERDGGACYVLEDDGTKTGPVCPDCYGRDGIVMLLERFNGGARCSRCKVRYAGVEPAVEGFRQRTG